MLAGPQRTPPDGPECMAVLAPIEIGIETVPRHPGRLRTSEAPQGSTRIRQGSCEPQSLRLKVAA